MKRFTFRGAARYLDGYTIIEVVIFLAVSGALLVATAGIFSGRQERIRFTQSVEAMELQLQDTFNDVSTGFYPTQENFRCEMDGPNNLRISSVVGSAPDQGENSGCIFVGKLIHFYADNDAGRYRIYTMVGRRDATSIRDKQVRLLGFGGTVPGIYETKQLSADVELERFAGGGFTIRDTAKPGTTYHSLAVVADFGSTVGPNNAATGNASRLTFYGYNSWHSQGIVYNGPSYANQFAPIEGEVVLCLKQKQGRDAALVISKQLTIERMIDSQPSLCP